MKSFLVCVAERLTPKMRSALKLEVKEKKLNDIKTYCRQNKLAYDMIPIDATNFGRIAVVLNKVKSIKG